MLGICECYLQNEWPLGVTRVTEFYSVLGWISIGSFRFGCEHVYIGGLMVAYKFGGKTLYLAVIDNKILLKCRSWETCWRMKRKIWLLNF